MIPDLDVMNNESPKAWPQHWQPESASNTAPGQPAPPQPNPDASNDMAARSDQQAAAQPSPDGPPGGGSPESVPANMASDEKMSSDGLGADKQSAGPPPPEDTAAERAEGRPPESSSEQTAEAGSHAAERPGEGGQESEAEQKPAEPVTQRRKIQIGSRRKRPTEDASPSSTEASASPSEAPEQENGQAKPPPSTSTAASSGPVPLPSADDSFSAAMEEEMVDALDDASLEQMLAGAGGAEAGAPIELESRHQSTVTRINGDNVFVSLGGRCEGVASLRQFAEPPELGAEVEVIVKSYAAEDGLYEVTVPGASMAVDNWSDLVEGMVVETRITGANTGGLECKVGGLRGFIPASQIALFRVEDYGEYVDQKMLCIVTEVNPKRKNLVLSRRAVLEREKEESRQQLLESLEVGQVAEGVVRKLMAFGAFVDIGGIDGLVHISQLSWDRVNHPSEILQVGQQIRVKIEKIDKQTGKIGLSYRDLLEHPWHNLEEKFPVDSVVKGTVSRTAKFGAFVKLAPGVEGLVHISELSHGRVPNVGAVVSEGQEVEAKVLSIDTEAQRIALSMKAVLPEPKQETEEASEQEDAIKAQREKQAAQRNKPLKGGVGRESGGAKFGLKW